MFVNFLKLTLNNNLIDISKDTKGLNCTETFTITLEMDVLFVTVA